MDRPWLIPVQFDDCHIADRGISGRTLADLQRADLFGDDYEQNADRLVAAIRRILSQGLAREAVPGAVGAADGAAGSAMPGLAGSGPDQTAMYPIDLRGAQGVQIGDGNIRRNTF